MANGFLYCINNNECCLRWVLHRDNEFREQLDA